MSALSLILQALVSIVGLRTENMPSPVGIDETNPYFCWQMSSQRRGASQKAYRLTVREENGGQVFDTGVVESSASLNIRYSGLPLKPCTGYEWKVSVLDETGTWTDSSPARFETGLMDSGWDGAQWIGSSRPGLSRYRAFFNIDFDVTVRRGSSKAVFAYSVKDSDNFISVTFDVSGMPKLSVDYCVEGELRHQADIGLEGIVSPEDKHASHHVRLRVSTPGYHLKSRLIPEVDGRELLPQLEITPYPGGEYITDWARMHSIGFRQPAGERARFENITISESNWGSILYEDLQKRHDVKGDGSLVAWEPYGLVSAPMLRRGLRLDKPVSEARLYVTARGIYECRINGERVGEDWFNPSWTDYRYRILYSTYDVTHMLHGGANAICIILGSGWFSDLNIFTSAYVDPYGICQSALAKLVIQYADGTSETIVSDGSWKKNDHGPVVRNGFFYGEDYDARKETPGWDRGGFDDSAWEPADILPPPADSVRIQAFVGRPIRNDTTLMAVRVTEPVKGTFVYDFGQNISGVPRIEDMKGAAGSVVTLRYGEMTWPEIIPDDPVPPYTKEQYARMRGQVYTDNYRGAVSIDNYIMKGSPEGEVFCPTLTCHGFRYVSITGLEKPLQPSSVKALVLESIGNPTSSYECSDFAVNKLFSNIQWGQRGNFQAVPTDCPQRDERQGWTGDAQVFSRTATYFSRDVDKFYARWFLSMRDNQNTDGSYFNYYPVTGRPPRGYANNVPGWMGWMDAGILVPWQEWLQFGDIRVLEEHWDSMERYMDYLQTRAEDYLQPGVGIGDHLAIERADMGLTNSAYYALDAKLMAKMARALGKDAEALRYERLYTKIKQAFISRYFDADGSTGRSVQTAYAMPLAFGILDGERRAGAAAHLVEDIHRNGDKLTTGFIGTPCLNVALSENGYDDVAYALLNQREYPSWLYPVMQGATTMWERWNSYTIGRGFGPVEMNSFNHYAYGAIGEWLFAYSLGIQCDERAPAYKHIILQPRPGGGYSYAKGGFESPYGRICSSWEKNGDGSYSYHFTIPANTTATLILRNPSTGKVVLTRELGSGSWDF